MYKNVLVDNSLFSSFLVSCNPEVSISKIVEECYQIKDNFSSKNATNINGYHSPSFSDYFSGETQYDIETYSEMNLLENIFINFCNDYLTEKDYDIKVTRCYWWVNINKKNSYNVLHNHKRTDVIGVYYAQCDDEYSRMVVIRNDGSQYSNLYGNKLDQLRLKIPLDIGRLYIMPGHLLHYVTTNFENSDRISIAFNLELVNK